MTYWKFSSNPEFKVNGYFSRRIVSCKVAAHEQETTTVVSDFVDLSHTPVHVSFLVVCMHLDVLPKTIDSVRGVSSDCICFSSDVATSSMGSRNFGSNPRQGSAERLPRGQTSRGPSPRGQKRSGAFGTVSSPKIVITRAWPCADDSLEFQRRRSQTIRVFEELSPSRRPRRLQCRSQYGLLILPSTVLTAPG